MKLVEDDLAIRFRRVLSYRSNVRVHQSIVTAEMPPICSTAKACTLRGQGNQKSLRPLRPRRWARKAEALCFAGARSRGWLEGNGLHRVGRAGGWSAIRQR
jgi:hypothetical protein